MTLLLSNMVIHAIDTTFQDGKVAFNRVRRGIVSRLTLITFLKNQSASELSRCAPKNLAILPGEDERGC
jgi:hypothetical protein